MSRIKSIINEGVFTDPNTNLNVTVFSGYLNGTVVLFHVDENDKRHFINLGELLNEWVRV